MYIETDELQSFLVLAEELHFGKAAKRLFLSQPALSKKIRRLEEKIGGELFARTRHEVALTATGRVLRPLAEEARRGSAAAFHAAKQAVEGRAGLLRIGFGIASVSEILPRTILRFRRAYHNVDLQMWDMSTPAQITALLDGGIDLGIIRLLPSWLMVICETLAWNGPASKQLGPQDPEPPPPPLKAPLAWFVCSPLDAPCWTPCMPCCIPCCTPLCTCCVPFCTCWPVC